jgi:hypothetical protein
MEDGNFESRRPVVLTASDAIQYYFEEERIMYEDEESNTMRSFFTNSIIQRLETGAADLDNDGYISYYELLLFVIWERLS